MPLNVDHLMNYRIAPVRQTYTARDSALYALSIGIGQDPINEPALKFVGGSQAVTAFPTLALVLGQPGFWLGHPDTGVDAVRLLHGEQSIKIRAPLPSSGTVIGTTRVTGLVDKGAGRGALLYSEKELTTPEGSVLAITRSTIFLRGDGGFGHSTTEAVPPPSLPDRDPDLVIAAETRPEQALYYRWNGDHNPLHSNPETARRAGYDRPILHGLCTYGIAARVLLAAVYDWEPHAMKSMSGRFTAPVYPGDHLEVSIWLDGFFRVTRKADGKAVVDNGTFA
ncbi:MaoC/PaaZ C-terminal domain-containing protein [Pseudohoeflea coraliihabitans]|uniref:MaoC family dehydratase N-terminal domain-containing protein n=1 Tax=Pseudohoeflea coraliihabitans TaxID=2860393 RepID=A0ABS6WKY3_9HYPH|nr:MaoC/PaaZ C-terminal domain-containing protein [Pseudohoeflea sp. DP4N28-3]MBW3096604.1 MaoC family dehydratase N-terminal domain-containing protein [Pseudohoeflea sp. DP4N28-3]